MKSKQVTREPDPMGFLVRGMTELLMYQLGATRCVEIKTEYGLMPPAPEGEEETEE